jgi:hypothetical protein
MFRGFSLAIVSGLCLVPMVLSAAAPDDGDTMDADFPYQGEYTVSGRVGS